MIRIATVAGLGLLVLAGCDASPSTSQVNFGGQTEQQMRQIQLNAAQSGANPGMQNPVATGTGVGGIVRDPATGARGNVTAGAPTAVNPATTGIVRQPGVGAPGR